MASSFGGDGVFSLLLNYPLVESYYYVSLLCLMGLKLAFWVLIGYGHFMGVGLLAFLEGLYTHLSVVGGPGELFSNREWGLTMQHASLPMK